MSTGVDNGGGSTSPFPPLQPGPEQRPPAPPAAPRSAPPPDTGGEPYEQVAARPSAETGAEPYERPAAPPPREAAEPYERPAAPLPREAAEPYADPAAPVVPPPAAPPSRESGSEAYAQPAPPAAPLAAPFAAPSRADAGPEAYASAAPVPPPAGAPWYPPGGFPAPEPDAATVHQVRARRSRVWAGVCLVLGLGLIGGAVAGAAITHKPHAQPPPVDGSVAAFAAVRQVWHTAPVDALFPRTVSARSAGPGGADRAWTRIGVAAPSGCATAFDPPLQRLLAPTGCRRLLRATYADTTSTTVTTVGLLVTEAESPAMRGLSTRWASQHLGDRADAMPRPVAFPGTPAAAFGAKQRGSWDVQVSADLPFVVYAVTGFADGRTLTPQSAEKATRSGATSVPAQAGLGYDATGLASAVDDRLHAAVSALLKPPGTPGTETSR